MLQHADELSLLQAQIEYKKRLESVMQELKSQEAALLERTAGLKEILLREQKDVQRLEGPSFAAFLLNVTGQKDSVVTRERREAYAAKVKYDTAMQELRSVQTDISETRQDLEDLHDCEDRYQQMLDTIRKEMLDKPDDAGIRLVRNEQQLKALTQQEQELQEAIQTGTTALRTMAEVQQLLHRAKDWSPLEKRSPAFWADHARQERLKEAQDNLEQLQIQFQRFNKELVDIPIRPVLQTSIDRMLKFADSFFDELSESATETERIRRVCALADQTQEHILGVLRQLQNVLEEVRHGQANIRRDIDAFVLQSINE